MYFREVRISSLFVVRQVLLRRFFVRRAGVPSFFLFSHSRSNKELQHGRMPLGVRQNFRVNRGHGVNRRNKLVPLRGA